MRNIVIPVFCASLLLLAGCGNKGDLYLESDSDKAAEVEQASEKIRKKPGTTAPETAAPAQ